jgi:hypothetical protein
MVAFVKSIGWMGCFLTTPCRLIPSQAVTSDSHVISAVEGHHHTVLYGASPVAKYAIRLLFGTRWGLASFLEPVNMHRFGAGRSSPSFTPLIPCLPCLNYPASSTSPSGSFLIHFLSLCDVYAKLQFLSGGGIGGLTLAFALSKSPDISVDIYEAASKFTEIGAGIGVWWRTRQVLKSLGLEEDAIRLLHFRPGEDRGELEGVCGGCMRI